MKLSAEPRPKVWGAATAAMRSLQCHVPGGPRHRGVISVRETQRIRALDHQGVILAKFQTEQSSFSRGGIGMIAGWAALDGTTMGDDTLARAEKLHATKAG
jgi:hypothetical protein